MEYDNGEKYLKEINHLSILESIDEVFDGVTSLMTENAIMYGSTITALLSGLPIVGDLDIAVSNQEFKILSQNIANSVKWIQVDGKTIQERETGMRFGSAKLGLTITEASNHSYPSSYPSSNPYAKAKHLPISNVVAFQTVNNARIQIIESKSMTGDLLEDALEVVRKVDFVFCGIAVDRYGRVLEAIPNAYSDCLQRVIRIKDYQPRTDSKQMKTRFHKYIKRGWSLGVSIDQALLNLEKVKREYDKKLAMKKKSSISKSVSLFMIKKNSLKGTVIETFPSLFYFVDSKIHVRDVLRDYATDLGIKLNVITNDRGNLEFWAVENLKKMTPSIARDIVKAADSYFTNKYHITYDTITKISQKLKSVKTTHSSFSATTTSGGYIINNNSS
jgi:hypothetical protein